MLITGEGCSDSLFFKRSYLTILAPEMAQRKILILTNRIPYPLKDGGNLAMNAMIEGYHGAGWQVYLLAMNTTRHYIRHEQLKKLFTHLYAFDWVDINNEISKMGILKNFLFSKEPEHAVRF